MKGWIAVILVAGSMGGAWLWAHYILRVLERKMADRNPYSQPLKMN